MREGSCRTALDPFGDRDRAAGLGVRALDRVASMVVFVAHGREVWGE